MTKQMEEWLTELRAQDRKLILLMEERARIRREAEAAGSYEKLYNNLYKDGKSHWEF